MLFNSAVFLFAFLPVVMTGFVLLRRLSWRLVMAWLAVASVVFYAWWAPALVWPLAVSVLFNYGCGMALMRLRHRPMADWVLAGGIIGNLGFLGYFKYAGFLAANIGQLAGRDLGDWSIFLPLGISFFTFTQLAYLIDVRRGIASEADFLDYVLFVTFFPHLIAGPIIHHKEMMPQFRRRQHDGCADDVAVGLALFCLGLFKKVVLADNLVEFSAPVFTAAQGGASVGLLPAWQAALAYSAQIYLDFSGYSDMAVGLARMVGIDLPVNFNSPYKARSIIDFWRRWHITLSRFLRDYLYLPLGGNRRGELRRHVNLALVMLIGGLWHGANWTFVVWGGLHGAYLIVNHLWRARRRDADAAPSLLAGFLSWVLTLLAVVVAWVFFRAPDIHTAVTLVAGMAGLHGAGLGNLFEGQGLAWAAALLGLCALAPNTQQILRRFKLGLQAVEAPVGLAARLVWMPTLPWAVTSALIAVAAVVNFWSASEFLYYQF